MRMDRFSCINEDKVSKESSENKIKEKKKR
jgi:hypothetical protein